MEKYEYIFRIISMSISRSLIYVGVSEGRLYDNHRTPSLKTVSLIYTMQSVLILGNPHSINFSMQLIQSLESLFNHPFPAIWIV